MNFADNRYGMGRQMKILPTHRSTPAANVGADTLSSADGTLQTSYMHEYMHAFPHPSLPTSFYLLRLRRLQTRPSTECWLRKLFSCIAPVPPWPPAGRLPCAVPPTRRRAHPRPPAAAALCSQPRRVPSSRLLRLLLALLPLRYAATGAALRASDVSLSSTRHHFISCTDQADQLASAGMPASGVGNVHSATCMYACATVAYIP